MYILLLRKSIEIWGQVSHRSPPQKKKHDPDYIAEGVKWAKQNERAELK